LWPSKFPSRPGPSGSWSCPWKKRVNWATTTSVRNTCCWA
jgi:hypothetical protein